MKKQITILTTCIVILASIATLVGIFSSNGPGNYIHESIHGQNVTIYGKGIYQHMSMELAPQGIAQDVVTLFIGIPLLIISLVLFRKDSFRGKILLGGTLSYFFLTYIFYVNMAIYNQLFLVYVALASTSFFALILTIVSFDIEKSKSYFTENMPRKFLGGFLILNCALIGLLWLSVIVPPLINGTIYPQSLEHYTTLVVQGFDLSIFLPLAFVSGWLLLKRKPFGYIAAPIYIVFLSILMTALTSKLLFQMAFGAAVGIPPLVLIPSLNITTIICTILTLKSISHK